MQKTDAGKMYMRGVPKPSLLGKTFLPKLPTTKGQAIALIDHLEDLLLSQSLALCRCSC